MHQETYTIVLRFWQSRWFGTDFHQTTWFLLKSVFLIAIHSFQLEIHQILSAVIWRLKLSSNKVLHIKTKDHQQLQHRFFYSSDWCCICCETGNSLPILVWFRLIYSSIQTLVYWRFNNRFHSNRSICWADGRLGSKSVYFCQSRILAQNLL